MEMTQFSSQPESSRNGPIIGKQQKADNSCLTFMANIGIVVLVVINIIALLLGIGLIIVGYFVKKEIDKHDDIMALLDLVDFGTFTLKSIVYTLIGVIIACGVFAIITSLTGGVGAFFGWRVLLIIYIIILILVIILELIVLSLWINLLNEVNRSLKGLFEDLLKEYTGFNDISVYTVGWDFIFMFFNCCAVTPVTSSYNDFQTLPSVWWASRGSDVIPFACCQNATIDNYLSQNEPSCTQNLQEYQESGCYDVFDELFTKLGSAAISITSLLLLIEITAIFFSIVIIIAVSVKKKVGIV